MKACVARRLCAALFSLLMVVLARTEARAGLVSGAVFGANGAPLDEQVHFENRVSGDAILVDPATDGGFSVALPPGSYDLRHKDGSVILRRIFVGNQDISLGQVNDPGFNLLWVFQQERIGEAIVKSPAPATARIAQAPVTTVGDQPRSSEAPDTVVLPGPEPERETLLGRPVFMAR